MMIDYKVGDLVVILDYANFGVIPKGKNVLCTIEGISDLIEDYPYKLNPLRFKLLDDDG